MKTSIIPGIILMFICNTAVAGECKVSTPIVVYENGVPRVGTSTKKIHFEVFNSKEDAEVYAKAHNIIENILKDEDGTFRVFDSLPSENFNCISWE